MSVGGSNLPVKGISIFDELFNDVRTQARPSQDRQDSKMMKCEE